MRWGLGPGRLLIQISLCQLFGFLEAEPRTIETERGGGRKTDKEINPKIVFSFLNH